MQKIGIYGQTKGGDNFEKYNLSDINKLIVQGYKFLDNQIKQDLDNIKKSKLNIENSESIDNINIEQLNKIKNTFNQYDNIVSDFEQGINKIEDIIIFGKEKFKLNDKQIQGYKEKLSRLKQNLYNYKDNIKQQEQQYKTMLSEKIQDNFEQDIEHIKYQVEVGKFSEQQAKELIKKKILKYKKILFNYKVEQTQDGKKKIVYTTNFVNNGNHLYKGFQEKIEKEFKINIRKEKEKEKYHKQLSDNYINLFKEKIEKGENKLGIYKYSDENIAKVVKEDLKQVVNQVGLNFGGDKGLSKLADLRDNIYKQLTDFDIDTEQMRHFLRIIPGSKLLVQLIIELKKFGAKVFVNISLIAFSIIGFLKVIFDFIYKYKGILILITALFLVAFTLSYTYKPAGSFFTIFTGFDYFYAPISYAIFKSFFMLMFIFYMFYVLIDVVFNIAIGFNKNIGYKIKLLLVNIVLLIIFSSLILS